MTVHERRRFVLAVIGYLVLIILIVPITVVACNIVVGGPWHDDIDDCIWEDCSDIDGTGPKCIQQGDIACLVVPQ